MIRKLIAMTLAFAASAVIAQDQPPKVEPKPFGLVGVPGGTGPNPAIAEYLQAMPQHTFYRPAKMPREAMPIVLWGNGGCRDDGLSAAPFLREIASHGYFIVVPGPPRSERAPGPPPVGAAPVDRNAQLAQRGPDATSPEQILAGLDWAITQSGTPGSPLHGHLDPARVGVMGHSCGGLQAIRISADPRIKATVLFNSGVFNNSIEGRSALSITKAELAKLHAPIAYIIGGPGDIAWPQAVDDVARIAHVPVFFAHSPVGHGGTFWSAPNGGDYAIIGRRWLDLQLKGKQASRSFFRGTACVLCSRSGWTVPKPLY